ncbi:MAG TPA: alpha/beta hydrolase [Pseudonocardia sp.]|jgi:haloacetate dehalogenase|nr:alpha/beta hydrolase [Pseudonocardia sp.]
MIEGFAERDIEVGDGLTIRALVGGEGPPLLLLHGYPQTHAMWHLVAPALARTHTVVATDLRGYGDSSKPAGDEAHTRYSKRAMADDQVAVMHALGFDRFAVVGHDRGARVAHRMCLDHPARVSRAAVLDIVPTRHMFGTADKAFGMTYYHWFFLAQPYDLPERLIGSDPEYYIRRKMAQWSGVSDVSEVFAPDAFAEYLRCFTDPATIHASCEDYRAAATIDLEHDDVDVHKGRRIHCPLLVLWGAKGFIARQYDPLEVWRQYADDVVGGVAVDSGHFLAEEAPEQTLAALEKFLRA